jgi:FkbM family methyltransferase
VPRATERRTIAQILLALLVSVIVCVGYATESLSEEQAPKDEKQALDERLKIIDERLRNAPGRTGILAESRRYSLFDEELIIRDFFQDRKGGFFLDVGCAWPIISNNTYYLEKHLGWTGFGIDALQEFAPSWSEERPNSKFFTFLVTDRSGADGTFFKAAMTALSSADFEMASAEEYGDPVEPEEIKVPMITLDDLLDREGIEKVDLISMDIEGHELQALAGFDIERFRPELIVVEGFDPMVTKYFHDHGYEQIERYTAFDLINRYFRPVPDAPPTGPPPSGR